SQIPTGARQTKPLGCTALAGQLSLTPSQLSGRSQAPAEARQTAVLLASAGQAPELPVQLSATSHWPAEPRQTVLLDLKTSAQVSLVPVQWSAASLSQAAASEAPVQCVVEGWKTSAGQPPESPGPPSATSHWPAEARQVVPLGLKASAGQTVLLPVQVSATSQSPAEARQTVPALPAGCWQALLVPLH